MDRALKILAALFATAAGLIFVSIVLLVFWHILPALADPKFHSRDAALLGLALGYGVMLLLVYALSSLFIWQRKRWNMAVLLAVAACFGFPVGPVLGVAALILLTRPAVRATFA